MIVRGGGADANVDMSLQSTRPVLDQNDPITESDSDMSDNNAVQTNKMVQRGRARTRGVREQE